MYIYKYIYVCICICIYIYIYIYIHMFTYNGTGFGLASSCPRSSSASCGLADFPKVDTLRSRYTFVKFGAGKEPGLARSMSSNRLRPSLEVQRGCSSPLGC